MRRIVVLGGGTAGTIVANRLRRQLGASEWDVVVVDQDEQHVYQPGLLLLPFGVYEPHDLVRPRRRYLRPGVRFVNGRVETVDAERARVLLADGVQLNYDYLVVATGVTPRPDQTPGMDGELWGREVVDFYTLDGARRLRTALGSFTRGRLVVHVTEMPVKCPVAALEMAFLTDAFLRDRGLRHDVDLTFVTPLDGAFTRPVAAHQLGSMLDARDISLEPDYVVDRIDTDRKRLVSVDDREVPFDLLITVPLNMGADFLAASGLGDELNCLPVDRRTLQSIKHDNVFAVGDATDVPTSKAGSVAHFQAESFVDNLVDHVHGRPMTRSYDGHAMCFVESGHGKGLLLDFDYDTEPLPGRYPVPWVGPFGLLAESRVNHWGKLGFRWAYWNVLLPGRPMPLPARMSMTGKHAIAT